MNKQEIIQGKILNQPMTDARKSVEAAMKDIGFGVLTEIDMQAKLEEKIGVKIKPYTILGICNPKFAYEAMQIEENIGVFLPCKVLLKQIEENSTEVLVLRPEAVMQVLNNEKLNKISHDVANLLEKAIANF
jgi:uncharacterized protein (DUF302 family)